MLLPEWTHNKSVCRPCRWILLLQQLYFSADVITHRVAVYGSLAMSKQRQHRLNTVRKQLVCTSSRRHLMFSPAGTHKKADNADGVSFCNRLTFAVDLIITSLGSSVPSKKILHCANFYYSAHAFAYPCWHTMSFAAILASLQLNKITFFSAQNKWQPRWQTLLESYSLPSRRRWFNLFKMLVLRWAFGADIKAD